MKKANVTQQENINKVVTKNGCYCNISMLDYIPTLQLFSVCERLELPKRRSCLCYKLSDLAVLHLVEPHSATLNEARWQKIINLFARALKRYCVFERTAFISFSPQGEMRGRCSMRDKEA